MSSRQRMRERVHFQLGDAEYVLSVEEARAALGRLSAEIDRAEAAKLIELAPAVLSDDAVWWRPDALGGKLVSAEIERIMFIGPGAARARLIRIPRSLAEDIGDEWGDHEVHGTGVALIGAAGRLFPRERRDARQVIEWAERPGTEGPGPAGEGEG